MSALSFLLLSIICGGLSLTAVAIANHKTRQQRFLKQKLQQLKFHVEELEERVLSLDTLCETRHIPRLLNEDVIERYQAMIELEPDAAHINVGFTNAKLRQEQFLDNTASRNLNRICDSDAHIARQQASLSAAASLLRRQHARGKLTTPELQEYLAEISWLHLQVEVITFIAQGHKAYNKKDSVTAEGYYKKAQALLSRSPLSHPLKQQMTKEVSDILLNKRCYLSEDLMPETQFNPTESIPPEPLENIEGKDKTEGEEDKADAEAIDKIEGILTDAEAVGAKQNTA